AANPAMTLFSIALEGLALLSFLVWLILFLSWGNFWHLWESDADRADFFPPPTWPRVTAVIPARNESASIAEAVRALAVQDYAGEFSITVADDHSEDGTAEVAARGAPATGSAPKLTILSAAELATGWTGKLWALEAAVSSAAASGPDYFWFTDADIVHAPDTLR